MLCCAGSRRDQQQAFFIGGSPELQDVSYVAVPKDHKGTVLNKYGYKTQSSGNVKVGLPAGSACCFVLERPERLMSDPAAPGSSELAGTLISCCLHTQASHICLIYAGACAHGAASRGSRRSIT